MSSPKRGHDAAWRAAWKMPFIPERAPTVYQWMVQNVAGLTLGRYTDIGAFSYLNAAAGIVIEEDVQIGSHCALYSVSSIDGLRGPIVLKRGCRIGSHSTILPGVTIGEGTLVGAHSLVRSDLPAKVLAFGVPAKVVRPLGSEEL